MDGDHRLLRTAADLAAGYLSTLDERRVPAAVDYATARAALDGPVPEGPTDAQRVIEDLRHISRDLIQ